MTKTPLHTAFALVPPGAPRRGAFGLLLMLAVVGWPQAAEAQLDPLLLLKRSLPSITTPQYRANVLVAVDVAPRMQYDADGNYYDPTEYVRGNMWDTALGVTAGNTTARYRRIYQGLQWSASAPQKFNATKIAIVGDAVSTPYTNFYQKTRLGVAKTALDQVIRENTTSVRFGLLKMRQTNPRVVTPADGPVFVSDPGQHAADRRRRVELVEAVPRRRRRRQPQPRDVHGAAGQPGRHQPEHGHPDDPGAAVLLVDGSDAGRQRLARRRRCAAGAPAR